MTPPRAGSAPDLELLTQALPAWLVRQRWFAGKHLEIAKLGIADAVDLGDLLLLVVTVTYADGGEERYQLPLVEAPAAAPDALPVGDLRLADALDDDAACRRLADMTVSTGGHASTAGGRVTGHVLAPVTVPGAVRRLGVEQSNSSAVFGDALILKVLRRLEPGDNPEVVRTAALTRAGNAHVPALRGSLSLAAADGTVTTLAVLSDFVSGGREGWDLAVAEGRARLAGGTATLLSGRARDLGAAVETVHATLRQRLGARPAAPADLTAAAAAMQEQLNRVLSAAQRLAPVVTAPVLAAREQLERALAAVGGVTDPGPVAAVHGDLHLGQVMLDARGDWKVLDFEGEPARSLAERSAPAFALRDVAGMLRSFDYVVGEVGRLAGAPGEAQRVLGPWRSELRERFLDGYIAAARAAGVLPGDQASTETLLDALELDKAIYELGYELANRPDWVPTPVGGILRLLDRLRDKDADMTIQPTAEWRAPAQDVALLVKGGHGDPHQVLGGHRLTDGRSVVRVWRPDAARVDVLPTAGGVLATERTAPGGLFEALAGDVDLDRGYRLRVTYPDGSSFELGDPYAFWPTLGDVDIHLAGQGRHEELWRRMGAQVTSNAGTQGTSFAVWAPNARSVRVVGDWNGWDGRLHPMRRLGSSGIWELFVPDVAHGAYYKFEIVTADAALVTRADPYAFQTEVPPGTASRVFASSYTWGDAAWLAERRAAALVRGPLSIYEVHLGSWRHRDGRPLTYRELAEELVAYVSELGFTHVEFLPAAEHPFGGSWGYQVTGYFAPTARFGGPDDFRYLVDQLHQAGIGVLVDWVPAHFPRDSWALARFDGTALYEHADPRQGEHPDWGTLVFNFGRNEVRNFLLANALFWLEELHVDGLRVDAVASMLYLDYSRQEGQWVPNAFGGRENLEAVDFLRELNATVYARNPDVTIIAEESTAWPGVSRPVHLGGLGFGFKWNMGWMHDTLSYFSLDAIYRRFHHNQLTFSLMYAFSENFILPLSHDEVVHGKRSLIDKMPGDRWQKFANLRALYGYQWAHPGKQLLFMGGEFGQWREWSEEHQLDWHSLDEPDHRGLQRMVGALNRAYRGVPALWERDAEPEGFTWLDANNADDNVLAFVRWDRSGAPLVCLCNFAPVVRTVRMGLPGAGAYRELLNTDAADWGGSNVGNLGTVIAEAVPSHGQPASALVTLPPLGTLWLVPE